MKKTNLYLIEGKKVPSVTQILSVIGKPELMFWYGKHGTEKCKKIADDAKDYGSLVHTLIEQTAKGQDIKVPDKVKPVMKNFQLITKDWVWLDFERVLISKQHRYGGTIDALVEIDGVRTLCDVKTSSGVYPEAYLQMSAYRELLPDIKQCIILHLNKDTNGWGVVIAETEGLFEVFLGVFKLYNYLKGVK